jgi:hypothetical protein
MGLDREQKLVSTKPGDREFDDLRDGGLVR